MSLRARPTNRLVTSPAYEKILHAYNDELQAKGKVNNKKFYEEVISKEIPNYSLQAWYQFLVRFKTEHGLIAAEVVQVVPTTEIGPLPPDQQLVKTLQSNQAATAAFIQTALNIGADRAKQILEHPELMTAKEAMDFALKAMKAQDSRMHAIGKIREDNREQEKFDRTFSDAAM